METCLLKTLTPLFEEVKAGKQSITIRRREQPCRPGDVIYLIEQTIEGNFPGNRICRIAGTITENNGNYTVELWPVKEYETPRRTRWLSNQSHRKRA